MELLLIQASLREQGNFPQWRSVVFSRRSTAPQYQPQ
jgi:hypothetical protein